MNRIARSVELPSAANLLVGFGFAVLGAILAGGSPLGIDAVVVGGLVGLVGAYDALRTARGTLHHPDAHRLAVLAGLWLVAFSLALDPTVSTIAGGTGLVVGAIVVVLNAATFVRRFRGRPDRRDRARRDGVDWGAEASGVRRWVGRAARTAVVLDRAESARPDGTGGSLPRPDVWLSTRATVDMLHEHVPRRYHVPMLLAVPIGVGAGLGAAAFRYLMYLIHGAMFGVLLPKLPSRLWIVSLPVIGALVAGFLIYHYAPEAAGHGVPENMEAIANQGGRIRHRLAPFKVLVSALTLGSGGSGGREGPIARIGAGVGSSLGQVFGLSEENTRLLLAAGIAGGIGATFGAPIGGMLFGIEIVMLYRVKLYNVIVLAITTLVAVGTAELLAPHFVWFHFLPFELPKLSVTPMSIVYALPYGVLIGIAAWLWVVILDRTEGIFDRIDVPDHVKPAIGAIPVGVLGIWYAHYGVMSVGYVGLKYAVTKVGVGAVLLLVLAASKLIATQFTIGSGGSGGVFAPTLYIGGLFAVGAHELVGVLPVSTPLIGIVGMGAMFSGAAFAPLTAMFLVAEVFKDYSLVAVLAVPCLVSFAISRSLLDASIYTSRLRRKGLLADYPEQARKIGPEADRDRTSGGDSSKVVYGRSPEHSTD